jgi:hypothetical protein
MELVAVGLGQVKRGFLYEGLRCANRISMNSIFILTVPLLDCTLVLQNIQSARLSPQSSDLAPPAPSPASECCPPGSKRGDSLGCWRRGGGSQFERRGRHSGTLGIV